MTKNRKSVVGIVALLILASTATIPTTIAMAGTSADEADIKLEATTDFDINANSAEMGSTYALLSLPTPEPTSAAIDAPILTWTAYNTLVHYDWRAGHGGDELYMMNGDPYQNWSIRSGSYSETVWPHATDWGYNLCSPCYWSAKTYNSIAKTYSEQTTEICYGVDMGNIISMRYGYECKYNVVGRFNSSMVNMGSKIPTSYDKDNYIWKHHSKKGHTIKGTIMYHDQYSDIQVSIPLVGYKTTSVTLDGQTFYLRTGPNKCSVKAKSSGIPAQELFFAFGID